MESGDAFACTTECEPTTGPVGCRQLQTGRTMRDGCRFGDNLNRLQRLHTRILLSRERNQLIAEEAPARAVVKILGVDSPIEHLAAFFATVVHREHIDLIRRLRRQQRFAPVLAGRDDHDGEIMTQLELESVLATLRSLDGASEVGVTLAAFRWVFGWKTEDLMAAFGMSRAAVDKQISRVRQAAERQADLLL
jgi:DNA-directed RNA polymerase specialized sigma24 family protein